MTIISEDTYIALILSLSLAQDTASSRDPLVVAQRDEAMAFCMSHIPDDPGVQHVAARIEWYRANPGKRVGYL